VKTKLFILISSVFFLISCAQIVPLTGGDKDIEPPKEIESTPLNGSVQFASQEITILFDEFIQLQNLQSQLVVSPYMENEPQVKVRGKKLIIELTDTLSPNTTYSLNFGNAIVDITENNPIPNYKYVFSTGDYLDSLLYSGSVVNAFDLSPSKETSVLLYAQFEDSVPYLERPRYIAMTDKEGKFEITNIAHGSYKVFAIKDINANYLFDLPNEEIAFESKKLELTKSEADNQLKLFEEQASEQFVLHTEHKQFGEVKFILNKAPKQLSVKHFDNDSEPFLLDRNPTDDTVSVWLRLPKNVGYLKNYDSLTQALEAFQVLDSTHVIDTITKDIYTKLEDSLFIFSSNINSNFDLNKAIHLSSPRPLSSSVNWENVKLLEDSVEVAYEKVMLKKGPRHVSVQYNFKEATTYQLLLPKGCFTDIYGAANDSISYGFKTKSVSDYGIIDLAVAPNFSDDYIVQLMRNNKVISQKIATGEMKLKFDFVKPGNYEFKLIVDANKDGQWTTGNYLKRQQPEKVFIYKKEVVIKPNWDNEISWIIKD